MRKLVKLTILFFKTTIGSLFDKQAGGRSRSWAGPLAAVAIAGFFVAIVFMLFQTLRDMFDLFAYFNNLELAVSMTLNIASLVIFVLSLMAAPAMFYFAKDVEYLLPMPIKPQIIIGAKFAMALIFEYFIVLAFIVPVFIAMLPHVSAGGLAINLFITFLTLPILPLVYSTLICMVMVAFFRIFRNPDKYSLIIGIVGTLMGVSFGMFYGQIMMFDMEFIYDLVMGEPVFLDAVNFVFFNNMAAARAISENSIILNQVLNIGVTFAGLVVFFAAAKLLYFRGVIGLSESGAPKKKMTRDDIMRQSRSQSKFRSYLIKELRLLMRSPTVFINCVLMAFLTPALMVGSILYSTVIVGDIMLDELLGFIDFNEPRVVAGAFVIMCALGFLVASFAPITATTISREGRNFFLMKTLPMSYTAQINAKAASGLAVILPAMVLMVVPLQIFLRAPILVFLGGSLLTITTAVLINYLGLLIDLIKPKLEWDNEQAAVKNNMNVTLMVLGGMAIAGGIGVGGLLLLRTPVVAFVVLFAITASLAALVYYLVMTKGSEMLKNRY